MDHRCLYGHRVPAAFTFAIQSRSCPTCGAATVTVAGYQAARKLTTEAGLEAVVAFNAIRVLEGEWVLTPVAAEAAATPAAGAALGAVATPAPAVVAPPIAAAPPEEEEVVVVDDPVPAPTPAAVAPPEPRVAPVVKAEEPPRITPRPVARPTRLGAAEAASSEPAGKPVAPSGFDHAEEDFFKGT